MEPVETPTSGASVSAKRTGVNIMVLSILTWIVAKLASWNINVTVDDLLTLSPILAVASGIWYRLCRLLTSWKPLLGWLLFGSGQEPAGLQPTKKK